MAEAQRPAASRIFISYRREDSTHAVRALLQPLRTRFGRDRIFKDTDNIPPGQDFVKVIQRELESCSVLLAIIGKDWATAQDRSKRRRLDNPHDFLRLEVATALKDEHVLVIPVLLEQASMPAEEELPEELQPLARRNAVQLSDSRWDSDVERLIAAIEQACGDSTTVAQPPGSSAPRPPTPPREAAPPGSDSGIDLMEVRRKRQIAGHVAAARQAFEANSYEAVVEACERALWLDPNEAEARDLMRRAKKELDQRKIRGLLAQARERLVQGDLGGAAELIDEALLVDGADENAMALRQELLRTRRERERQREIARLVATALAAAQKALDEEEFDAAIHHCDDALMVLPESEAARDLRGRAVAARDLERQQRDLKRRAQQTIKEAQSDFAAGRHDAALERLRSFTPEHELVSRALEDLAEELEATRRKERVDALFSEAAAAVAERRFKEAVALLWQAQELDRRRPEVARLLDEALAGANAEEARERARRDAEAQIARAVRLFELGNFVAAREFVEAARLIDPAHPELEALQQRIDEGLRREEHDRRVQEAIERARGLAAVGNYDAAVDLLASFGSPDGEIARVLVDIRAERERMLRAQKEEQEAIARAAREKAAHEQRERERRAREQAERDRVARAREEQERLAGERAEQERLGREQEERARLVREQAERERQAREREERERQARERREQQERERGERQERERAARAAREREAEKREAAARQQEEAERRQAAAAALVVPETAVRQGQPPVAEVAVDAPVDAGSTADEKPLWQRPGAAAAAGLVLAAALGLLWLAGGSSDTSDPSPAAPTGQSAARGAEEIVPPPVTPPPAQPSPQGGQGAAPAAPAAGGGQTTTDASADETRRQAAEAETRQKQLAAEQTRQKALAEEQARQKQLADEQAKQKQLGDEQAKLKQLAEEQAKQKQLADDQAKQKQLAEEQARQKRLAEEQAKQQQLAEEQARQKQLADEQQRQRLAEETRKRTEEDARRKAAVSQKTEQQRVLELLAQYEAAFENLDAAAVTRIQPGLSESQLARQFAGYRSFSMQITNPRVSISGNTATLVCTIETAIRPRVGDTQSFTRETTIQLEKKGELWMITDRR